MIFPKVAQMHDISPPTELVKPKAKKRRRKAIFSTRKQRLASRMRQEMQRFDSLRGTIKTLEFSPERSGQRVEGCEALDICELEGTRGGTPGIKISQHLSRICETQV